jgi:hypothetical protein
MYSWIAEMMPYLPMGDSMRVSPTVLNCSLRRKQSVTLTLRNYTHLAECVGDVLRILTFILSPRRLLFHRNITNMRIPSSRRTR